MPALEDYEGREQSYIKHVLLERNIEALIFKTASTYDNFVYVDGFAGPWQSTNETFDDTSFGIALNALQRAKDTWKQKTGRDVKMTAILVEKDAKAFAKLKTLEANYPGVEITVSPTTRISGTWCPTSCGTSPPRPSPIFLSIRRDGESRLRS